MRLAIPGIALLLAASFLPGVTAEHPHDDPADVEPDDTVLQATATAVVERANRGVRAAHAGDHAAARAHTADADALAALLTEASRDPALADQNTSGLRTLAGASRDLAVNVTRAVDAWARAGDTSGGERRLLVAVVRDSATRAAACADTLDAFDVDTRALRDALVALADAAERMDAPGGGPSGLHVEVVHSVLRTTDPVEVHGVLTGGHVAGVPVTVRVNGTAWANASTDAHGFFRLDVPVPAGTPPGVYVATAHAAAPGGRVESAPAPFVLEPTPTRLRVVPAAGTVPSGSDVHLAIRLTDHLDRPVPGTVVLHHGDARLGRVETDADGRATFTWRPGRLPLGTHTVNATYTGTVTFAGSAAEGTFSVTPAATLARPSLPDMTGVLVAGAAVAVHVSAAEGVRVRGPTPFRTLLVLGPAVVAALAHAVTGAWPWTAGTFAAASLASLAISHRAPALAPSRDPAPRAVAAAAAASPAPAPTRAPVVPDVAFPRGDPRHEVIRTYRDVLVTLAAQGVDMRARTPREAARALVSDGRPEAAARTLTRIVEATLYAEAPVTDADLTALRDAARALGVGR